MIVLSDNNALKQVVDKYRDKKIAFVPTMGNLHRGHLSLVDVAREKADLVIVSIYVNPIQFGENEDYSNYPRTLGADSYALCQRDVDFAYTPSAHDLFVDNNFAAVQVNVPALSTILCGKYRPGHFEGVATIVAKLFNLVQPDIAVFGQKDYQQLKVIEQMVQHLQFPIEIIGASTVREEDGLAMSSRNQYLNEAERIVAPELYRELLHIKAAIESGATDFSELEIKATTQLTETGFKPDYISVRNARTLENPKSPRDSLVILGAAWLGDTRLIDNIVIKTVED